MEVPCDTRGRASARVPLPSVVANSGMHGRALHGNQDISGLTRRGTGRVRIEKASSRGFSYGFRPRRGQHEALAAPTPHPSSVARAPLCRHSPKVAAQCANRARWDLCGGCPVTGIPTAISGTAAAAARTKNLTTNSGNI